MLTQEQIQNLKNGDPIVVKGIFSEVYADGNIVMQIVQKHKDKIEHDFRFFDPYSVSLPSEIVNSQSSIVNKHDPTRLFREGDIVKRRTVDGRTDIDVAEGINLTVTRGESIHGNIVVKEPSGRSIVTKSVFLELVTPVEELEPYTIELGVMGKGTDYRILKDGVIICAYSYVHPNAKAA